MRIIDQRGFIKVQVGDAEASKCLVKDWQSETERLWGDMLYYKAEMERTPDFYLCIGGKCLDFSNTLSIEQLETIMASEFMEAEPTEEIILVASKVEIG
jgi:hypothetical protein